MQVKDVMTTPAITVRGDATLHDVAEILAAQRISGLPVLDRDGALVGVISEADIIREGGEPDVAGAHRRRGDDHAPADDRALAGCHRGREAHAPGARQPSARRFRR